MRSMRPVLLAALLLIPAPAFAQPFAYVLSSDFNNTTSVRVINTATTRELASIDVGQTVLVIPAAVDLAVSPSGDRVYVVSPGPATPRLIVIDTRTNSIASSVTVGAAPTAVAVSPDGTRIYVANGGDNTVSVINASTLAIVATITVGQQPAALAHSADGSAVYVTNSGSGTVSRIATATNTVTGTATVAANPTILRLRGDGARAYVVSVATPGADTLSIVDTSTMSVTSTLALSTETVRDLVVLPDGSRAFFSVQGVANIVTKMFALDLATSAFTVVPNVIPLGSPAGIGLALDAAATRVYITIGSASQLGGSVRGINVSTLATVSIAPIDEGNPIDIALPPANVPCQYEVFPLRFASRLQGGTSGGLIPAPSSCAWTVDTSATASWAHITAPASSSGTQGFTITTDPGTAPRTTTMKVAGQTITIKETVPQMFVEIAPGSTPQQPFRVTGWAIDRDDRTTTFPDSGVDFVHVWAFPASGAPIFVGSAASNDFRVDLGAAFGSRYANSGFTFFFSGLATGTYRVQFFAHSSRGGGFSNVVEMPLTVVAAQRVMVLDSPRSGETYSQPFLVTGWAIDANALTGHGVDLVHVWAFPVGGGTPSFLGSAPFSLLRHDVAQLFGPNFVTSGFVLAVNGLTPGAYHVVAYARSTVTGTFNNQSIATITVGGLGQPLFTDPYPPTVAAGAPIPLTGWAIDQRASAGTGVSVVHVWAYPAGGGAPVLFGIASANGFRPDVFVALGSRFANSGWGLTGSLTPGTWDIVIYAFSTVTSSFDNVRVIRIIAQ